MESNSYSDINEDISESWMVGSQGHMFAIMAGYYRRRFLFDSLRGGLVPDRME